jgi:hypothetical protein
VTHGPATVRVRVNDPHGGRSVAEASVMVDGAAPVIGHLRRGASVLAVKQPARKRPRANAGQRSPGARRPPPPRATTVRFSLTEPAAVTLGVDRARRGRRLAVNGPCDLRARTGRHCVSWSPARSIDHAGAAGENAIRLRARGLHPGLYRLVLSAVDGVGNASAPRMAPLRVVPLPRQTAAPPRQTASPLRRTTPRR